MLQRSQTTVGKPTRLALYFQGEPTEIERWRVHHVTVYTEDAHIAMIFTENEVVHKCGSNCFQVAMTYGRPGVYVDRWVISKDGGPFQVVEQVCIIGDEHGEGAKRVRE